MTPRPFFILLCITAALVMLSPDASAICCGAECTTGAISPLAGNVCCCPIGDDSEIEDCLAGETVGYYGCEIGTGSGPYICPGTGTGDNDNACVQCSFTGVYEAPEEGRYDYQRWDATKFSLAEDDALCGTGFDCRMAEPESASQCIPLNCDAENLACEDFSATQMACQQARDVCGKSECYFDGTQCVTRNELAILPRSATINKDELVPLLARHAFGPTITDVTGEAEFSKSSDAISIAGSTGSNIIKAEGVGTATVRAAYIPPGHAALSATATITVIDNAVSSYPSYLELWPVQASLNVDAGMLYKATAYYTDGSYEDASNPSQSQSQLGTTEYVSSDEEVASFSQQQNNRVLGNKAGTADVAAAYWIQDPDSALIDFASLFVVGQCLPGVCDTNANQWCDGGTWSGQDYCAPCASVDSGCTLPAGGCTPGACDTNADQWCDGGTWSGQDYCASCASVDSGCTLPASDCTPGACDTQDNKWCNAGAWVSNDNYCTLCRLKDVDTCIEAEIKYLSHIRLEPKSAVLNPEGTQAYTVAKCYSDGDQACDTITSDVIITSTNTDVATMASSTATADHVGKTTIFASYTDATTGKRLTDTAQLEVTQERALSALWVSSYNILLNNDDGSIADQKFIPGYDILFTVFAVYTNGEQREVTAEATYDAAPADLVEFFFSPHYEYPDGAITRTATNKYIAKIKRRQREGESPQLFISYTDTGRTITKTISSQVKQPDEGSDFCELVDRSTTQENCENAEDDCWVADTLSDDELRALVEGDQGSCCQSATEETWTYVTSGDVNDILSRHFTCYTGEAHQAVAGATYYELTS